MTVEELIEKLKTYPGNALVIYSSCSEFVPLNDDQISFVAALQYKPATMEKLRFSPKTEKNSATLHTAGDRIIQHHGFYMYCPDQWIDPNNPPKSVDVVTFPGN